LFCINDFSINKLLMYAIHVASISTIVFMQVCLIRMKFKTKPETMC